MIPRSLSKNIRSGTSNVIMDISAETHMNKRDSSDEVRNDLGDLDDTLTSDESVVFDILRIPPEQIASQITLMDLPVFKSIQPDELTSCAWTSKEKLIKAPNIVALTRKFNNLNFLVQKEILTRNNVKIRSEVLTHFIKVAKKLHDMNNLHSQMAILSALYSQPIFRLERTWMGISKRDKSLFEKMVDLFSENNNRSKLREYMGSVKLPCIPYLGCYLTDLVYINVAHPHSGGLESEPRRNKMNNILRTLAEFQQSNYDHLTLHAPIRKYLTSVRYIEELQKFVEDDNYKLSLEVEPNSIDSDSPGRDSLTTRSCLPVAVASRNDSFSSIKITSSSKKLKPSISDVWRDEEQGRQGQRYLIDDSILGAPSSADSMQPSSTNINVDETSSDKDMANLLLQQGGEKDNNSLFFAQYSYESFVKRKVLLKHGKKPTVSRWVRYWMALWRSALIFFPSKCLSGSSRDRFREDPCKMTTVSGLVVILTNKRLDTFTITDPQKGNSYKFRSIDPSTAFEWCRQIEKASAILPETLPDNLISFE